MARAFLAVEVVTERPNRDAGVNWIGAAYPVNADPERDTWNGQPIKRTWNPMSQQYVEPKPLTLADFLDARISEDEAGVEIARGADVRAEWLGFLPGRGTIADRMAAECEAKRQIIDEHGPAIITVIPPVWACNTCSNWDQTGLQEDVVVEPCPTLRILASVYADHPDYDEAWRP